MRSFRCEGEREEEIRGEKMSGILVHQLLLSDKRRREEKTSLSFLQQKKTKSHFIAIAIKLRITNLIFRKARILY